MTVATFRQPNYTSDEGTAYPLGIDAAFSVLRRLAGGFAPHEQNVGSPAPDLTIAVDAGHIWTGFALTEIAQQSVSGFTIPVSGTRIDRVVLDPLTGVASRIAGTAAVGSPSAVPPAITHGKLPICQVTITSTDTVITNDMIVDERPTLMGTPFVFSNSNGFNQAILGHSSPSGPVPTLVTLEVHGTTSKGTVSIVDWSSSSPVGPAALNLARSKSATIGSFSAVGSGDWLGHLLAYGDDGDGFKLAADIRMDCDGPVSDGVVPGRIVFSTANSSGVSAEAARIDSSQRMLLGDDESQMVGAAPSKIQVSGDDASAGISVVRYQTSATGPQLNLGKSRNATIGSHTIVQSGDTLGVVAFHGSTGAGFESGVEIRALVDATPGSPQDMPGRLVFSTSPDGSATITEAFRLDSGQEAFFANIGTTGSAANAFLNSGSSPANQLLRSTSSARYKDDIRPIEPATVNEIIKGLRPVRYRSRCKADNPEWSFYGLVAEEVAQVDPRLVHWARPVKPVDSVDDETGKVRRTFMPDMDQPLRPESVMYERVAVLALAKIQQLEKRIEELEGR